MGGADGSQARVRRLVVAGGHGFFGGLVVDALRARGHAPLAPRRGELDVEDAASIARTVRGSDIIIDAAGPFQRRSAKLVEVAAGRGADVIDLSDSLDHVMAVLAMRTHVEAAGTRVLTACSAVSVATAVLVARSGLVAPERVSVCLAPASAETATRGTAGSLLAAMGSSVRVLRGGQLLQVRGWSRSRPFWSPTGFGDLRGHLAESADAATLPLVWPSLREVDFWVDSHTPLVNPLLRAAALVPGSGRIARPVLPVALRLARRFGAVSGGFVVEAAEAGRPPVVQGLFGARDSFMVAVLPAVLASEDLMRNAPMPVGIVPADRQVEADRYLNELAAAGIELAQAAPG
jgi:hypothetical protein